MKRLQCLTIILFVLSSFPLWAQNKDIRFVPESYSVGVIEQGDVRHIVLKGVNTTSKTIVLESVMSQNTGSSNFKHPSVIKPNETITIEFDLNTSYMEGAFNHSIVLVDTTGAFYTTTIEGDVQSPVFFSEKMFDAGYYKAREKREWTFYVWSTDKKTRPDIELDSIAAKSFSAMYKSVMLNIDKLDQIKEGGKVPALKVTLKTKGIPRDGIALKQKSLRHIVAFKSKAHPKATPEILIVGYWK